MLCEAEEKYSYRKEVNKPHDKIFKDVLDDRKYEICLKRRGFGKV